MTVELRYHHQGLKVELPEDQLTLIRQQEQPALPHEYAAFEAAVGAPVNCQPLEQIVQHGHTVALIIPDGTRPLPSGKLLGFLFRYLKSKKHVRYRIILGTGSHRANTAAELVELLGEEIVGRYEIINHNAFDKASMACVGTRDGGEVWMNKAAVEADVRIALGFIEPHLWAGFSGGYKAVMPGITDIDTIGHYHRGEMITDSRSGWGRLKDNPTQELVRRYGQLLPIDFLINIAMNQQRETVAFYCGHPIKAHERGCEAVKENCMMPLKQRFPIVITTNNGFPLDQNLYQAGKGLSAAAQIVAPGGLIILACACSDGFPNGSHFHRILTSHDSPAAILQSLNTPGFQVADQWSVHFLANLLMQYRVALYSMLPEEAVRAAHLTPIDDIGAYVEAEFDRLGRRVPIAVLPEGFLCIPYIADSTS
ncbi:MAG: nickel-dependent lactate racemase [Bacteroidetes bacterium]|nr:MAG: nickel-dependent lactate racemase [Bacteroidota bacterium]